MEKKYYFRGLGLGIIVTALIMGIALSHGGKKEITDAEVIARARELGMIENTTLLEPTDADGDQEKTEPAAEKKPAKEPVKKDVAVAQPKDNAVAQPKEDGEAPSKEQPADRKESGTQKEPAAQADPAAKEETTKKDTAQDKKPQAGTNEMTKQDEDTGQAVADSLKQSTAADSTKQTTAAASVTIVSGDGSYTVAKKLEEAGVVFSASDYDDYLCQNGYDKRLRTGTFQIPAGASNEQIARIVTGQP